MKVRTSNLRGAMAVLSAAMLLSAGCDEPLKELTGPSPNLTPTFASVNQEIFLSTDLAGRVACVGCHTSVGGTPAAGLNLAGDAHAAIVGMPSRQRPDLQIVDPGTPEGSYLIHKLEGRPGIVGLQMPRIGPPHLTAGQLQVVRRWIAIGAPR
jgi:hypothetical protein